MADVTISQLSRNVPSGNNILPYSTGSNTLGVPVSAIFQNVSTRVGINSNSTYSGAGLQVNGSVLLTLSGGNQLGLISGPQRWDLDVDVSADNAFRVRNMTYPAGVTSTCLTIVTAGNIGIGVVSPTTNMKMDLYGNLRVAGKILLSDVTPQQGTEYSQVGQVFAEGTINANSSVTLNLNGVSTWPCAGILAIVLQSQILGLNPFHPNSKACTVRLLSFVRTLSINKAVSTIYSQDSSLLSISEGSDLGLGYTVLTNNSSGGCNYSVRVLPVLARIWPVN